jgi:glycosyltransferase involved in cell wall biosynthesis
VKIGILSDCRVPTVQRGGHGLGRVAIDLANELRRRGQQVTLYAGPGSAWDGELVIHEDEQIRAMVIRPTDQDVWLDLSHLHSLSGQHRTDKVVNYILDNECGYQPPNALVCNEWQRQQFPKALIAPLGIDVDAIPLSLKRDEHLVYCAKIHPAKGFDLALQVGKKTGRDVHFYGQMFVAGALVGYRGLINDDETLYQVIGGAAGLLSPSREDAGGRVNLEAAACGTGVLCLDGTGTMYHVEHGVSGWVCKDADEMADAVADLRLLNPVKMREWVKDTHDVRKMGERVQIALCAVRDGERW